jgi:hypothetical protein
MVSFWVNICFWCIILVLLLPSECQVYCELPKAVQRKQASLQKRPRMKKLERLLQTLLLIASTDS